MELTRARLCEGETLTDERRQARWVLVVAVAVTIAAMAGLFGSEMLKFTLRLFNDFPNMT